MNNNFNQVDWDFRDVNHSGGIHTIHPYPAKFIPEIPRALIEIIHIPEGTIVFDPFCGSGATLTEAQAMGYQALGIDVNPIACLISKVKTSVLSNEFISVAKKVIDNAISTDCLIEVPKIPRIDHWFKPDIQLSLARLLYFINNLEMDESIQNALRLAVSSIIVKVSNQESDTRYAAIKKSITSSDVYKYFNMAVKKIWEAKSGYKDNIPTVKVLEKDIAQVKPSDIEQPVGLVITSPPYPNAYEYWLYHKYRMYWLGYDPISVREKEIGARAHYYRSNPPTIEDFINQMTYVIDLLSNVVVKNGHVCIIIGRSKIHGQIIDNASIIEKIGVKYGFQLVAKIPRNILSSRKYFNLSHANIKTEYIIIFRKS